MRAAAVLAAAIAVGPFVAVCGGEASTPPAVPDPGSAATQPADE